MHEQEFYILEGQKMTLPELGREIENITGFTIKDSTGEVRRDIGLMPNFESELDTYVATYRLNNQHDLVDAVFTIEKSQATRIKEVPVDIKLMSYISKK